MQVFLMETVLLGRPDLGILLVDDVEFLFVPAVPGHCPVFYIAKHILLIYQSGLNFEFLFVDCVLHGVYLIAEIKGRGNIELLHYILNKKMGTSRF